MIDINKFIGLSYPEAFKELQRQLGAQKASLSASNFPIYQGKLLAPKSSLTQKAQDLTTQYGSKPQIPYSRKMNQIQDLLANPSFTEADKKQLLLILTNNQSALRDKITSNIKNQLGKSASYVNPKIEKNFNKAQDEKLPSLISNIDNIQNPNFYNLNAKNVRNLQDLLLLMSKDKQVNRQKYIDMLSKFGNQEQASNNMLLEAKKQEFDRELAKPYLNINRAADFLNKNNYNDIPLELNNLKNQELVGVANAYNTNINPNNVYKGQRTADLNQNLTDSYKKALNLLPQNQDTKHAQIKEIIQGMINKGNISSQVIDNLDNILKSPMEQMLAETSRRGKEDLKRIGNQFASLGQYGSGAHMRAAAKSSKELDNAYLTAAQNLILKTLDQQGQTAFSNRDNEIKNVLGLARQNSENYSKNLNDILSQNKIGESLWANEQDKKDKEYKDYLIQNLWQYPHLRSFALESMEGGFKKLNPNIQHLIGQNPELNRNNIAYGESPMLSSNYLNASQGARSQIPQMQNVNNQGLSAGSFIARQKPATAAQNYAPSNVNQAFVEKSANAVQNQINQMNKQRAALLQKELQEQSVIQPKTNYINRLQQMIRGEDAHFIPGEIGNDNRVGILDSLNQLAANPGSLNNMSQLRPILENINNMYNYNPNVFDYLDRIYNEYKPNIANYRSVYPYQNRVNLANELQNMINNKAYVTFSPGWKEVTTSQVARMLSQPALFNADVTAALGRHMIDTHRGTDQEKDNIANVFIRNSGYNPIFTARHNRTFTEKYNQFNNPY